MTHSRCLLIAGLRNIRRGACKGTSCPRLKSNYMAQLWSGSFLHGGFSQTLPPFLWCGTVLVSIWPSKGWLWSSSLCGESEDKKEGGGSEREIVTSCNCFDSIRAKAETQGSFLFG